jgi:hypothetical protein
MKDRRKIKKRVGARDRRKPNSSCALHESSTRIGARARKLASLLRQTVDQLLPRNSKVLVVSKGDENLIRFDTCRGAHFPQESSGTYAGFYPASSAAAICHLEALRFQGADYLVVPATANWWLETYPDFIRYLQRRYASIENTSDIGSIYSLRARSHWLELDETINAFQIDFNREPAILNWDGEFQFSEIFPECQWFQLPSAKSDVLPYLDKTIDFVAISRADPVRLKEARRVATAGLIVLKTRPPLNSTPSISVERLGGQRDEERPLISLVVAQSDVDLPLKRKLAFLRETVPAGLRYEVLVRDFDRRGRKHPGKTKHKNQPRSILADICRTTDLKRAKGDIVILIGPRTIPLPGWLPPVLRLFSEKSDAGVVGGRLINFDGTQNHIGGIAGRNGSVELLGTDEVDPGSPAYGFVRELDFCTATFLATRGSLMRTLPTPAKFGDGDLSAAAAYCSAARNQGCRVYFEPDSWAITFSPAPAGRANLYAVGTGVASSHRKLGHRSDPPSAPGNGSRLF